VLALVALGTFMTTLDASIVNIGLPSIARTFRAIEIETPPSLRASEVAYAA